MSLNDRIKEDLATAMKAREADRTRALRMIRAAFIEAEKDGSGGVNDERGVDILRRLRKQRLESIEQYQAGGRADLVAAEQAEIDVIDGYLPKLADESLTRTWVVEAIAGSGAASKKEVGKVMGWLMKNRKGQVDAGIAKAIAEALLP